MKSASFHSEKPPAKKPRSTSNKSGTDLRRLRTLREDDIVLTGEHPEMDISRIVTGIARRGLKPVPVKQSISLRVDQDVLQWFKEQGDGYQTRMNLVLRAFKEASS